MCYSDRISSRAPFDIEMNKYQTVDLYIYNINDAPQWNSVLDKKLFYNVN